MALSGTQRKGLVLSLMTHHAPVRVCTCSQAALKIVPPSTHSPGFSVVITKRSPGMGEFGVGRRRCLEDLWAWVGHVSSLSLSFPICQIGIVLVKVLQRNRTNRIYI
jgi:hypothetical protein